MYRSKYLKGSMKDLEKLAESRKFPMGFTIRVVRKEDILATIDKNILDKDVALEIVSHCELSAANYFKNGYWASVPYLGNFRLDPKKVLRKQAIENMDAAARRMLDPNNTQEKARYVLFRKQIAEDAREQVEFSRYYNYIITLGANKHVHIYNRLVRKRGKHFARLFIWGFMNMSVFDNRFEYLYNAELDRIEREDNDKQ